jgi:hypothetical protein
MTTLVASSQSQINKRLFALLGVTTLAWLVAYNVIQPFANWISYSA